KDSNWSIPTSSMITNRMFGGCPACGGPSDDDELLPPNLHEASTSVAANSVPVVSILDCMAFPSFLFSAETVTRLLRKRVTLIAPPRSCRRLWTVVGKVQHRRFDRPGSPLERNRSSGNQG